MYQWKVHSKQCKQFNGLDFVVMESCSTEHQLQRDCDRTLLYTSATDGRTRCVIPNEDHLLKERLDATFRSDLSLRISCCDNLLMLLGTSVSGVSIRSLKQEI